MGGANALASRTPLDKNALIVAGTEGSGRRGGRRAGQPSRARARGSGGQAAPALEAGAEGFGKAAEKTVEKVGEAGVLGSLLHGNIPGAALSLAAPAVAPTVGKVTASMARGLGNVGRVLAKNPASLGKYGAVLARAANAGPAILNATLSPCADRSGIPKEVLEAQDDPRHDTPGRSHDPRRATSEG
jgi:hypothetical protein